MNSLSKKLKEKKCLEILEAHNGLSALIVEDSRFDGIWISSLTHSASKGLPDTELVSLESRANLVKEIRRVTKKPIIVDSDTGGQLRHFPYYVKWFEDAGADAIVIEDKQFPKENSLGENAQHTLEDVDKFARKIESGKKVVNNLMIIARLESLIAKHSIYEALIRAEAFVDAGADGILIHSKLEISATEVMEFAKQFRKKWDLPLVAIPTTYNLPLKHPFDIIIYANQMLRVSLKAMKDYVRRPDKNKLASVSEVLKIHESGRSNK